MFHVNASWNVFWVLSNQSNSTPRYWHSREVFFPSFLLIWGKGLFREV